MEEAPASLVEVQNLSESLVGAVDGLRDLVRVTVDVDAPASPGLKVKNAHGQNIGLTLNRFVTPQPGAVSSTSAEAKKQKETTFVQLSQQAAKAMQQIMVHLKDARANVSDPNKICDKAFAVGSKLTNLVVPFIKTIKSLLGEEGSAHHVLQMVPADVSKIHDAVAELQRLVETWSLTCRAGNLTVRGKAPTDVFAAVKDMGAQAILNIKAMSDAVSNVDVPEFTKRARESAVLLSKIIKHAQNRGWKDVGDKLLQNAQSLISAGKVAVKNPEAQKDFYEVVGETLVNVKEFLRLCKTDVSSDAVSPSRRPSIPPEMMLDVSGNTSLNLSGNMSMSDDTPSVIRLLGAQLPGFKQVWERASEAERNSILGALQKDLTPPSTPAVSRTAPQTALVRSSTSTVSGEEVQTEADLADVERGFIDTLRDMQKWFQMLRAPFRFWSPNFDKTDYEAIIDRSTDVGKAISTMVEPVDSIAGATFLLIVNANLCVGESTLDASGDRTSRLEMVEKPAKLLFSQFASLLDSLKKASLTNSKDAVFGLVTHAIGECNKWVDTENPPALFEEDKQTIGAASGLFIAGLVAASLKGRLYNECNRVRVTCIHLCSMLVSLKKYSSLLPHQLLQISSGVRLFCEAISELTNLVVTQIAVIRKLQDENAKNSLLVDAEAKAKQRKQADAEDVQDMLDTKSQQALELLTKKAEKKSEKNANVSIWRDSDDSNVIWEDKTNRKGLRAASLNKLVLELTSTTNYDTAFVQTFVATYQSFTTPTELFDKLMERYEVPSGMDQKMRQQIRLRVAIVVKHWVEHQFADFDQAIIIRLYDLCKRLVADSQESMGVALQKLIQKKDEARLAKLKSFMSVPPTDLQIPSGYANPMELFMLYSPQDIAQQMTIVDFAWFSDIEARELLNQCWSKPKLQFRARNVLGLINRVNILSFWIPSLILWPEKLKQRVKVFEKFISVADELRRLGNFSSLMAILIGVGQSSTSRLTHTKNALSAETKRILADLENLMSPQRSFANYRAALRATKPPGVPYLGVYLQDLTFVEEGNPEQIDGLINFERLGLVYGVLKEVLMFQQQSYGLPVLEPINTLLVSLPCLSEKVLYDLSLVREPRGEMDPSKIK